MVESKITFRTKAEKECAIDSEEPDVFFLKHQNKSFSRELRGYRQQIKDLKAELKAERQARTNLNSAVLCINRYWSQLENTLSGMVKEGLQNIEEGKTNEESHGIIAHILRKYKQDDSVLNIDVPRMDLRADPRIDLAAIANDPCSQDLELAKDEDEANTTKDGKPKTTTSNSKKSKDGGGSSGSGSSSGSSTDDELDMDVESESNEEKVGATGASTGDTYNSNQTIDPKLIKSSRRLPAVEAALAKRCEWTKTLVKQILETKGAISVPLGPPQPPTAANPPVSLPACAHCLHLRDRVQHLASKLRGKKEELRYINKDRLQVRRCLYRVRNQELGSLIVEALPGQEGDPEEGVAGAGAAGADLEVEQGGSIDGTPHPATCKSEAKGDSGGDKTSGAAPSAAALGSSGGSANAVKSEAGGADPSGLADSSSSGGGGPVDGKGPTAAKPEAAQLPQDPYNCPCRSNCEIHGEIIQTLESEAKRIRAEINKLVAAVPLELRPATEPLESPSGGPHPPPLPPPRQLPSAASSASGDGPLSRGGPGGEETSSEGSDGGWADTGGGGPSTHGTKRRRGDGDGSADDHPSGSDGRFSPTSANVAVKLEGKDSAAADAKAEARGTMLGRLGLDLSRIVPLATHQSLERRYEACVAREMLAKASLERLEVELEEARQRLDVCERRWLEDRDEVVAGYRARVEGLNGELATLRAQCADYELRLGCRRAVEEELRTMRSMVDQVKAQHRTKADEHGALALAVTHLRQTNARLEQNLQIWQDAEQAARVRLGHEEGQKGSSGGSVGSVGTGGRLGADGLKLPETDPNAPYEEKEAQWREYLARLGEAVTSTRSDLADSQSFVNQLIDSVDVLTKAGAEKDGEIARLAQDLDKRGRQNIDLIRGACFSDSLVQIAIERGRDLERAIAEAGAGQKGLNESVERVQREVGAVQNTIEMYQKDLADSRKQIDNVKAELRQVETAAISSEEESAEVKKCLHVVDVRVQELSDRLNLAETSKNSLLAECKRKDDEVKRMNATLTESKEALDKALKDSSSAGGGSGHSKAAVGTSSDDVRVLRLQLQEFRTKLVCSVCMDHQKDTIITKCMHTFCRECVNKNLKVRSRKCPKCGKHYGADDVKKYF